MDPSKMVKVYGFMSWMTAGVCFFIWLIWAWVPDHILQSAGLTYYPSKWWAISVPTHLVVSMFFAIFMYSASTFIVAPPLHSITLIRDSHSEVAKADEDGKFDILNAHDLPLSLVNSLMFESSETSVIPPFQDFINNS